MDIIYVAGSYSKKIMDWCLKNVENFSQKPGSKFHRLIAKGFLENQIDNVHFICNLPLNSQNYKQNKVFFEDEITNGICYHYCPYHRNQIKRKYIEVKFIKKTIEKISNNKEVVIICDILNATLSTATLQIAKKLNIKCFGIITDLPSYVNTTKNLKSNITEYVTNRNIKKYDGYIVITSAINDLINKNKKPYVVVECITSKENISNEFEKKRKEKKVDNKIKYLYAGGMNKKYGIPELVEGFKLAKLPNTELHLYGNGDYTQELKNMNLDNFNIIYHGVTKNDEILVEEKNSNLLINPRSPHEDFAKYSFPSKNMEYMSSGTPMIGYKLPGIPKEYYQYMYTFTDFSAQGIADGIKKFEELSETEHIKMGKKAQKFIFEQKNNKIMAKKIIEMIKIKR